MVLDMITSIKCDVMIDIEVKEANCLMDVVNVSIYQDVYKGDSQNTNRN